MGLYDRPIGEKFQLFCSDLRIPQSLVNGVSTAFKQITKQLNKDFYSLDSETAHSVYLGSYGRGTAIDVDDIDMLFVLPPELFAKYSTPEYQGQTPLREAVKESVRKIFPTTYLGSDGQVVRLDFTKWICFEMFPAFLNEDGSYTYPDSNGGGVWNKTNPKPEMRTIINADVSECNKNLTRLCRMIKIWRDVWKIPINGFLIDTLAYDFMMGYKNKKCTTTYYDWMIRDFFEFLKTQDPNQEYWSAPGSGDKVYRRGPFEEQAALSYDIALKAIDLQSEDVSKAVIKWREIFGPQFPM